MELLAKATRLKKTVHWGSIFDLCTEKGSELPDGDPLKKFKGRVVFLADSGYPPFRAPSYQLQRRHALLENIAAKRSRTDVGPGVPFDGTPAHSAGSFGAMGEIDEIATRIAEK